MNAKSKIHYETVESHRWKDVNLLKIKKKYDLNGPSCMEAKDYRNKRYFHIFGTALSRFLFFQRGF